MTAGATADLSIFHQDRAGENPDERTYHGWLCSLEEGPDDGASDGFRTWWLLCRKEGFDESVLVEQDLHTLRLRAYVDMTIDCTPPYLERAAMSFVREEPGCEDGEP
jgi:hypothetical protein